VPTAVLVRPTPKTTIPDPSATLEELFLGAVAAADPAELVRRHLRANAGVVELCDATGTVLERHAGSIFVTGAGKGGAAMARAVTDIAGVVPGCIAVPVAGGVARGIRLVAGGHPLPTAASAGAGAAIMRGIGEAPANALLLVLLSGGASALCAVPSAEIGIDAKAAATARLLECGAAIAEINVVRKHLSRFKGGGLARLAAGRPLWTLVLSDVVGDDVATIGSGPTAPDPSTFADAVAIVERYGIAATLPVPVVHHLRAGAAGGHAETPKSGDPCFASVRHVVIGGNRTALEAAAARARVRGFAVEMWAEALVGDTTTTATGFAETLRERQRGIERPTCIVAGGETTVVVRGPGRGGRNQEFALVCALALDGTEGITVLSCGSDGIDGSTAAAGAIVSGATLGAARAAGVDARAALAANDSAAFFARVGGLVVTGPTGTNVMDIKLAMLVPAA
jgi:hydroxypyruvate reductase